MLGHEIAGLVGLAGLCQLGQVRMLLPGIPLPELDAHGVGQEPVSLGLGVKIVAQFKLVGVGTGRDQRQVKLGMRAHPVERRPGAVGLVPGIVRPQQPVQPGDDAGFPFDIAVANGLAQAGDLDLGPRFGELGELGPGHRRDRVAALRLGHGQAVRRQARQGLARRPQAYPMRVADVFHLDLRTGRKPALDDIPAEGLVDHFRLGRGLFQRGHVRLVSELGLKL